MDFEQDLHVGRAYIRKADELWKWSDELHTTFLYALFEVSWELHKKVELKDTEPKRQTAV